MADHVYKPSEVPKGQRWQHFLDYYKIPFIASVIGIIALVSILKSTVFAPKRDVSILAVTSQYVDHELWDALGTAFNDMPMDYNNDRQSLVQIDYINLDESTKNKDPEAYMAYQTKFMAALAAADSALQIVDDTMYDYFESEGLVATYGELQDTLGHDPGDIIKIPLKELVPFKRFEDLPDGLYMTLRPKEAMQIGKSQKKLAYFENQKAALALMIAG